MLNMVVYLRGNAEPLQYVYICMYPIPTVVVYIYISCFKHAHWPCMKSYNIFFYFANNHCASYLSNIFAYKINWYAKGQFAGISVVLRALSHLHGKRGGPRLQKQPSQRKSCHDKKWAYQTGQVRRQNLLGMLLQQGDVGMMLV